MKALLIGVFFIYSAGAGDLTTQSFWLCLQKRATEVGVRTLRLHHFPEDNRYVMIYTKGGQDQVECQARRRGPCQKVLNKIKANLEKGLWECKSFPPVKVFYPIPETHSPVSHDKDT